MWLQEGDVTTSNNLLPEELLVDILVERFQVSKQFITDTVEALVQYIVIQ